MKLKIYYTKPVNLKAIEKALEENFGINIENAGFLAISEKAFNKIRNQYNAILLLAKLPFYSVWIIDKDIYVRGMNFVFGLAMNKKAIVSSYRLPEEMIPKEVVHEVGHIFGLEHCKNECVMQFSNSLFEAMKKPAKLCNECKRKLMGEIN